MQFMKLILFHVLLSSRGVILGICKLCSLAFIFSGVLLLTGLIQIPVNSSAIKATIVMASITFTLMYWFYDYLLFYLKPKCLI